MYTILFLDYDIQSNFKEEEGRLYLFNICTYIVFSFYQKAKHILYKSDDLIHELKILYVLIFSSHINVCF